MLFRTLSNKETADDVFQESSIRAFKAFNNFRVDSMFNTWLYRIANNQAKNQIQKERNQNQKPNYNTQSYEELIGDHAAEIYYGLETADDPAEIYEAQELLNALSEAMKELRAEYKEALTLREFEGLSYEQVAKEMNTPIGTVRSRICRAREDMQQALNSIGYNVLLLPTQRTKKKAPAPT